MLALLIGLDAHAADGGKSDSEPAASAKADGGTAPAAKGSGGKKGDSAAGPRGGSGVRKAPSEGKSKAPKKPESEKPDPKKPGVERPDGKKADGKGPKPKKSSAKSSGKKSRKGKKKREPHQVGRAPRKPKSRLPEGQPHPEPRPGVRRAVAEGVPHEHTRDPIDDEEIRALLAADRVLFSKPLDGVTPGWSWGFAKGQPGPGVSSSGLPPVGSFGAVGKARGTRIAWIRNLAMPNLPVRLDARVVKYLKFYRENKRGKAIARAWARKSGRFTPALKAEIAKRGLPTDLVWLSLIESGHNPAIFSHAGAAGLWQFIPDSGRMYGLTVDRWVDERLDPQRATEAAVSYLSDLRTRFGNWELAMAAYNMGQGGLQRSIRKYNSNDFWELSRYEAGLPWETALYVPKIAAIAIVMNNKAVFGIDKIKPASALSFDTVLVPGGISLATVARAAGTNVSTIKKLNLHYLAERTPPNKPGAKAKRWRVNVPRGSGASTRGKLAKVARFSKKLSPYVVRFGDTLSTIALEYGWTKQALARVNKVSRRERLAAGTVLLVPKGGVRVASAPEVVVVPPRPFAYPARRRVFFKARSGDSLATIARALGVKQSEVLAWNALDEGARLVSGMVLQVFVPKSVDLSRVRVLERPRVLTAGSKEFFRYFEGKKGRRRIRVIVKSGDSLWKIAKRYGMSVGMVERINHISRHKALRLGQTIIVYTKLPKKGRSTAPREGSAGVEKKPLKPVPAS